MEHVLIVDDDMVSRELLQSILSPQEYETTVAGDLQRARELLKTRSFALVLLDLNLPDGHGLDLLAHIRGDLDLQTPVIILSGLKQEVTVLRGLELGASDYITKSFSPKEVQLRIKKVFMHS